LELRSKNVGGSEIRYVANTISAFFLRNWQKRALIEKPYKGYKHVMDSIEADIVRM